MLKTDVYLCNRSLNRGGAYRLRASLLIPFLLTLVLGLIPRAFASDGTLSASGITSPSGTLNLPGSLGGHLWISDHTLGFCRLDATAPGSPSPIAINPATCNIKALSPGQAAFDATNNLVYVPDNSSKSQGVWRLRFDPTTETVITDVLLGPNLNLGILRPTSVALSANDGKLYVSNLKNGNIARIVNPQGSLQTLENVGASTDGKRVVSIGFVGWDLYLTEKTGITRIGEATSTLCTGNCKAAAIGVSIADPMGLAIDATSGILYFADLANVYRFTLGPGTLDTYSMHGNINGTTTPYEDVSCVGLDASGNLMVGDDPSAGATPGQGRLWSVAAGSAPDVAGSTPPPPAGLALSAQYASQVTAPNGVLFLPDASSVPTQGHAWVADHTNGFCRLDPMLPGQPGTLYTINLSTCNVSAVSPGQPAFDAATNFIYVPDNASNSRGVWRLTFDPVTETVASPVLLAPNAGLGGNRPSAASLGADGKLYVSFLKNGNISRLTTPGGSTQKVEAVGGSSDGRRVLNLAFIGNDLYLAETNTVTRILGATSTACTGSCKAASLGIKIVSPTALISDGVGALFAANPSVTYRYTIGSNVLDTYSSGGTYDGATLSYKNISGLGRDPSGNIYVADDPTAGASSFQGRVWQTPAVP